MSRVTDHAVALCRRAPNAKTIRIGSVSTTGPVSQEDRVVNDALGGERLARVTVATVPTAAFPDGIARHGTATIAGTVYTIRDVRLAEDGELTEIIVAESVS